MKTTLNLLKITGLLLAGLLLFPAGPQAQTQAAGPERYAAEPLYEAAYDSIRAMLDGQRPLSFKRAVYLTENAYLEGRLDWQVFDLGIRNLAEFTHLVRKSRKLLYDGPDSLEVQRNAAIFSVLKDSILLLLPKGTGGTDTVWLEPMGYDFRDFSGRLDWSQMFVSKLLETGKGNCHSLPFLYKILADETGAKAWLSLAPNHTYIKTRSEKDGWYNTELTSGHFPHDAWIMASGYIHLDAIRSGLYMDTLSDREAIALALIDLAQGYEKKFGTRDGDFILKACNAALAAFPDFVNALLLKAETERQLLFQRHGVSFGAPDPSLRPGQVPDSLRQDSAFKSLTDQYGHINRLGYRRMPDAMYLDWLWSLKKESGDFDDRDVVRYRPPPKYKADNPFKDLGYETEVLTLSGGKYIEDFDLDSLERIGAALYNWQTGRIAGFVLTDTVYSEYSMEPELISRWLSPDPLAAEFPGWSPYNYVLANPILLVDPDGRSPDCCPWAEFAVGFADRAAQVSFPVYGVYRSVATAPQTVSGLYDHAAKLVSGQGTLTDYLALFDISGTARTINEVKHVRELYDAGEYQQLGVMAYNAIAGVAAIGVDLQATLRKPKINTVDDLINNSGELEKLKGKVRQGHYEGSANSTLHRLAKKYGAKVQQGGSDEFFKVGDIRVGKHTSTRGGDPSLHINYQGQLYKIRFTDE